ncbi:MAG: hypothetical protein FWH23_04465 [Bacteroidales bacterium]|nr:hypothetical protein [Bacteroidales bacterium]MCL2133208.1 hypothetical protein [Bacteroidales bacterium]
MKLIKYFAWFLWGVSAVILILFLFGSKTEGDMGSIGMYLSWGYILIGVAALAAIGLPLIHMAQNPKLLKKTLLYIGIMLIVGIIAYLLATEILGPTTAKYTANEVKWTETGIIATYFFLVAAVLAIFAGGLINMIRNR